MLSTIGWIALWVILSLVLYVIVEGVFHGGWNDPDVKGSRKVLKWSFLTALLPLRLLVRSFKEKQTEPIGTKDGTGVTEGDTGLIPETDPDKEAGEEKGGSDV